MIAVSKHPDWLHRKQAAKPGAVRADAPPSAQDRGHRPAPGGEYFVGAMPCSDGDLVDQIHKVVLVT